MKPFDYARASSADEALAGLGPDRLAYAGGTDLLTRMKLGITVPERLVDVKGLDLPDGIDAHGSRLEIGALATLADLERERLPGWCALLSEAAAQAATPQIRERATLGGNLLQRPRCWYYREPEVSCWLKGGDACPARTGRSEQSAIFDASPCIAVHPSDLAACLVALDARVALRSADGAREAALDELLAPPEDDRRVEHRVGEGELVASISAAAPDGADARRSVYVKAMDRKVWAFALVGVAAAGHVEGGRVESLSLVASGVANVPRRLGAAADALVGEELTDARLDEAARAATADASPTERNAYKVDLLGRLVKDAVRRLARAA